MPTYIYLAPGMFGFGELARFNYFEHVRRALEERFANRGRTARVFVCDLHPTASIRRRARTLAKMVAQTSETSGRIHIVGHSTGGLDARLVASPSVHLPGVTSDDLAWLPRLRSITTINTPHYGTPVAAFFATVSGQRALYAITALTVSALKFGTPPLAAASALLAVFGRLSGAVELEVIERTTDSIVRVLDDASSRELRAFLQLIRDDQGGMVQLMPEAMDLFQAAVEDRPGIRYQSVASYAPGNGPGAWARSLLSPWAVISAGIFTMLASIAARHDQRYPCHPPDGPRDFRVRALLGEIPTVQASDGVVPFYSQVWGDLIWAGRADHLDIVGHFPGRPGSRHNDWLRSGAKFDQVRFDTVMDRIVAGILKGEEG